MVTETIARELTFKKFLIMGIPTLIGVLIGLVWFFWGVGLNLSGEMNGFLFQSAWFLGLGFIIYISFKWFEYVSKNVD